MIDIRNAAGERLVLNGDQPLTVEQAAGWLADDELPGAFSYPIRFPIPPNEAFLQSGYRPQAARPDMELVVTARLEGVLYRRCVMSYRVTEGEGDGFLKIDGGEVFSKLRRLSLQEALPGVISMAVSGTTALRSKMLEMAQAAPGVFPFTFFPIRNELFFEEGLDAAKVPGFVRQPYVNAWGVAGTGYGFLTDTATVRGYPVSPQFYLCWVLEQLFQLAGYRMAGDWVGDPEVQRLVVINQTAIRTSTKPLDPHGAVPGQHLPKMSVGDFLKSIRQRFGLLFSFDGNRQVVTIRRFTDVIKSAPVDLSRYLAGPYGIDASSGRGYKVLDFIDSADELYRDTQGNTIQPVPLIIGGTASSDREEVKLSVGTTQLIHETSPMKAGTVVGTWTVPTVRLPGNTLDPAYNLSDRYPEPMKFGETILSLKNDTAPRIVSYRGLVASSNNSTYPLGTPDVRNGKQEIIGTSAATLNGRNGQWRQVLRQFYYFRDQTRPVTVPLDLPVSVAANLKLHEPIALKLEGQARRSYLINKLLAESPGPSGLMECKLTALTIPDGIELPADVDEPVVWVSLTVTTRPVIVHPIWDRQVRATVTVHVWANAQKTQPAVATSLPVTIRRKKSWRTELKDYNPEVSYEETLRTYLVSGQKAEIETDWLIDRTIAAELRLRSLEYFTIKFALDPGDDYIILK